MPDRVANPRTSLSALLLAYMLVVVLFCTVAPFQFQWPNHLRISVELKASDMVLNLFLFLIPGFLYQASRPSKSKPIVVGLMFGLACSVFVEAIQLFLPLRFTSPVDLATNALGAAAGAYLHHCIDLRVQERAVNRLFLQLPLMGSFYLLLPLLWLIGLTAESPTELLRGSLLGLTGATILASVWKHRLQELRGRTWVVVAASFWYLAGSLPALMRWPLLVLLSTLLVGATALVLTSSSRFRTDNRRFELFTLTRAVPFFALYLLSPLLLQHVTLAGTPVFEWSSYAEQAHILGGVEYLSAFTVLGYLVAESKGRSKTLKRGPLVLAGSVSLLVTFFLGISEQLPTQLSPLAALALALSGSLCGAGIYARQLATLRSWLATERTRTQAASMS